MTTMADDNTDATAADGSAFLDKLSLRTRDLETGANGFSRAMTSAFARAVTGGKQLDDVLKSLALRLSDLTLKMALKPLESTLSSGLSGLFKSLSDGLFGTGSDKAGAALDIAKGAASALGGLKLFATGGVVTPFAEGGVVANPTYFPLGRGLGLAGEAGPEAILPLARGSDGRLGVAASGGAVANVTIHIATPDADSFRRSEANVTGQIARAVARGQRSL
jgi:lambda family phage tail tape measure protein